jgi:hypothetical protein
MKAAAKRGVRIKRGPSLTKEVTAALDALAEHADQKVTPYAEGLIIERRMRRPHGRILIVVADDNTVTLRTLKRSVAAGRLAPPADGLLAEDIAARLAEIEAVRMELEPRLSSSAASLTAQEEKILVKGGLKDDDLRTSAKDNPLVRTAAEYANLVRDSYSTDQAATLLDVNSSRIRQRVARDPRTLYGIRLSHGWRIPKFQFDGRRLIPGIEQVLPALPRDVHPVAVHRWFTLPNVDLVDESEEARLSPLDWLRTGRSPQIVAELAADL